MANTESFKAIKAGGGIAGLAVANSLEDASVNFLVLEKREIAPQLETSILIQYHRVAFTSMKVEIWFTVYPFSKW
ncbi:hypothetical protein F4814DRAFT_436372 [Daldinia grandis]|nr:hypothetical protein F4814DRAFT_436372 [Daldinia grandis]